mmetsp:Transcript_10716/g.33043  ORF Transcript_10716/g.33043 Transcript_10716/m.33043 type:complete len:97 (+) Transcript_10716:399-689(+)
MLGRRRRLLWVLLSLSAALKPPALRPRRTRSPAVATTVSVVATSASVDRSARTALRARPDEPERRELDPVIGKAIVEKGGFFLAVIALAVLFEKLT